MAVMEKSSHTDENGKPLFAAKCSECKHVIREASPALRDRQAILHEETCKYWKTR